MTKQLCIGDVFSKEDIELAMKLKTANKIAEQITIPNIERYNRITEQENDPKYLAYLLEYVVSQGVYGR